MADSDSTVRTNIEVVLTKDDSGKAAESLGKVNEKLNEAGEEAKLPQRELRVLAHQLGEGIPGASELMRAGFVAGTEGMLAGVFLVIGGIEILKKSIESLKEAQVSGAEATEKNESINKNYADSLKDLIADAAQEAAIHLRHLNSEYDTLAHNLTSSLAAINNHADAVQRVADANDAAAISQIKLDEAIGRISLSEAESKIAKKKLESEIAKKNLEINKEQQEANAKNASAGQETDKATSSGHRLNDLASQQADKASQIAGIDRMIAQKGLLGDFAALSKAATEAEVHVKNVRESDRTGLDPIVKAMADKADKAAREARGLADAADTSGLEEHKKQLQRQKKDLDDQHEAAQSEYDAAKKHAKSLIDEANAIDEKIASQKAANASTNATANQTLMTEDATNSINRLHQLESERPSQQRTQAIDKLISHLEEQARLDAQDRDRINTALRNLQNQIHLGRQGG